LPTQTVPTVYFDQPGPQNTAATLEAAQQRAEQLGLHTVLVASSSGATGVQAVATLRGCDVVVVTHVTGFHEPNVQDLLPEHRAAIEAGGGRVLTAQHAFGGIGRAVRRKLNTYQTDEIIAYTLRVFGEGTKVCLEIALMAADAGLVRVGEPCIAVAGTNRGADTAIVLLPANTHAFFDLRVLEMLARPRLA